jgi:SsrA-binding protein
MAKGGGHGQQKAQPVKGGKAPAHAERLILYNRKLRHDYAVIDRLEAGVVLMGSEVKSLRAGEVQWGDAHARFDDRNGALWLFGLHIGEYHQAAQFGHQPLQPRKLLLHAKELERLRGKLSAKGLTVIPERIFFKGPWVKLDICLCSGKDKEDQRRDLIARAHKRDVDRELMRRSKGRD